MGWWEAASSSSTAAGGLVIRGLQGMQEESRAEGRAEGLAQGMQKGMAKGKHETQENVVINMLKDGELALDKIAKYSGLTLKRVKELAKALA